MRNILAFSVLALLLSSACSGEKIAVDLIIHHATIYTADTSFSTCEAMAIKNGRIAGLGSNAEVLEKYSAKETSDLQGKIVFPGFIDAHCHFLAYGLGLGKVNLVGTVSFSEVIDRVIHSSEKENNAIEGKGRKDLSQINNTSWIVGRGWDQNDWKNKEMPDKRMLDSLFPKRPVLLTRIDGHAVLVNSEAMRQASITANTKIAGGEIELKDGKPTGILVDNAVDLVSGIVPKSTDAQKIHALLNAQENCIAMGLTTVDDAGLMKTETDLIDQLQKESKLKIRIYAMLSDSAPNYRHFLQHGPYKTDRLNVRSFKYYVDGALGSRGACLFKAYSDKPGWQGFLLSPVKHFEDYAAILSKKGFQMNAHCIGDSAVSTVVNIYAKYCSGDGSRRWRIEHAQVVGEKDLDSFNKDIIPSVQPTHATSDMYWVPERLGAARSKNAYANKKLLNASGIIALGTDFPVEDISPFKTFYAAVARQDAAGFPAGGFQRENALSREETIRGMTIWAAYSNFEEHEKGSLEKGKFADFVVLDTDLMKCAQKKILSANVVATYIAGEKVYGMKK